MKNNEPITDKLIAIKILQEGDGQGYIDMSRLSDELKNDKHVILSAIILNSYLFQEASDELRDDKEFVLYLITKFDSYFRDRMSEYLDQMELTKKERETLDFKAFREKMDQFLAIIQFTSDRLKDDEDVMREAIAYDSSAFTYASERLKNDKEFILSLKIDFSPFFCEKLSQALQDDAEFMYILQNKKEDDLIASIEKELDEYHEEHSK